MVVPKTFEDFLTFYHEVRTPAHPFFRPESNHRDEKLLVVSSPSRMGNHLLMSMLDDHPDLPRVPGEDGHHIFSFTRANEDLYQYLCGLRGNSPSEFLMDLASNGGGSKWREFDRCYRDQTIEGVKVSGVGVGRSSATIDFEGVLFEIDFSSYESSLKESAEAIRQADCYSDVLHHYLSALSLLDPLRRTSNRFDRYFVYGGMRTQLKWLCQTHPQVRILTSVRSFPSYAISQIKSRHGNVEPDAGMIRVAWEHWYHKVVDALYLAIHYPENVGIVTFEDLIGRPGETRETICRFLGISKAPSMEKATIFGHPVKGNSWSSRVEAKEGEFYRPARMLADADVPDQAAPIWEQVELRKLS